MAQVTPIKTPAGELRWVIISGEGKANMSGKLKYTADLVMLATDEKAIALKEAIDAYWESNKPTKGWPKTRPAKSLGYRMEKTPVLDENGEKQYDDQGKVIGKETGNIVFSFQTDTTYGKSGDPKVVSVFNAKGSKVHLGDKKIGNGSIGQIGGAMGLYTVTGPKGDITDAGVTLYLNSVRIIKFEEFSGEDNWDATDEEGGWTGEDNWDSDGEEQAPSAPAGVPKL